MNDNRRGIDWEWYGKVFDTGRHSAEISNCGCGGSREVDDEEVERAVREIEEERGPELIPVEIPIPAPDVFQPKKEEAEVA